MDGNGSGRRTISALGIQRVFTALLGEADRPRPRAKRLDLGLLRVTLIEWDDPLGWREWSIDVEIREGWLAGATWTSGVSLPPVGMKRARKPAQPSRTGPGSSG